MDTFAALMGGFATALQPEILLYGFLGCLLGTMVGVLPGIGPALTIALLLPLTYKVPAAAMFVMFAGVYYGAMYGGSTTSILINTPGESATVVTALEGYKMAKKGRAVASAVPGRRWPRRPSAASWPAPWPRSRSPSWRPGSWRWPCVSGRPTTSP
jgi:TctA family transporter